MSTHWPKVIPDDDGIRPAGKPDECFYCDQRVGRPHAHDCVMIQRKVRVRITLEIDKAYPADWSAKDIEFHNGESSWCASNIIQDIEAYNKTRELAGSCLCRDFQLEVISLDPEIFRENNRDEVVS